MHKNTDSQETQAATVSGVRANTAAKSEVAIGTPTPSRWLFSEEVYFAYFSNPKSGIMPDAIGRERVDTELRKYLELIPTEPGLYLDTDGQTWRLHEDGGWEDHTGEKRGPEYTPLLGPAIARNGTWQRVSD